MRMKLIISHLITIVTPPLEVLCRMERRCAYNRATSDTITVCGDKLRLYTDTASYRPYYVRCTPFMKYLYELQSTISVILLSYNTQARNVHIVVLCMCVYSLYVIFMVNKAWAMGMSSSKMCLIDATNEWRAFSVSDQVACICGSAWILRSAMALRPTKTFVRCCWGVVNGRLSVLFQSVFNKVKLALKLLRAAFTTCVKKIMWNWL